MTSKEIALSVAEAFNKSDAAGIINHFADDAEWNMLGDKIYKGKENIAGMFNDHASVKIVSCTFDHVIADGNTVAIDGYVECKTSKGEMMNMFYCDIYEIENDKVKTMISYTVNKKS